MIKHTPGPWKHNRGPVSESIYAPDGNGHLVAILYHGDADNQAANARLIAAAPDLLEALEELLQHKPAFRTMPLGAPNSYARQEQYSHIAAEDKARAAIAKAKGEAQ